MLPLRIRVERWQLTATLHSQSSSIIEASSSDCLWSYPGRLLGESYPSAEIQSVYYTVPVDWDRMLGKYWNQKYSRINNWFSADICDLKWKISKDKQLFRISWYLCIVSFMSLWKIEYVINNLQRRCLKDERRQGGRNEKEAQTETTMALITEQSSTHQTAGEQKDNNVICRLSSSPMHYLCLFCRYKILSIYLYVEMTARQILTDIPNKQKRLVFDFFSRSGYQGQTDS